MFCFVMKLYWSGEGQEKGIWGGRNLVEFENCFKIFEYLIIMKYDCNVFRKRNKSLLINEKISGKIYLCYMRFVFYWLMGQRFMFDWLVVLILIYELIVMLI